MHDEYETFRMSSYTCACYIVSSAKVIMIMRLYSSTACGFIISHVYNSSQYYSTYFP